MNSMKHFFGCAMTAWLAVVFCAQAPAQSSFADPAKPQAHAGGAPAEKSVLAKAPLEPNKDPHASPEFCQCVGESETASVAKIEQALRGPLHSSGLDFVAQPLADVVTALQDDYGIPIQLDTTALEEIGTAMDQPVTVILHNISLRSALRLMLKPLNLTYVIQDEVLLITTRKVAESQLKTCVYDVAGLNGERDSQLDALIDTIHSCVASDTWAKNGGNQAEIRAIKPGLLVISQTQPVHDEIRNLLATIRKMREVSAPKANSAAIEPHSVDQVVTRSYLLQLVPTNDNGTMRSQVRELIVNSLPEEAWTGRLADGQAVTLTVFHDRIVVRQTPAVQDKVEKILSDSGVATPAQTVAQNTGGGGGFDGGGLRGGGGRGFFSPEVGSRFGLGAGPGGGAPTFRSAAVPGTAAPGIGGEGASPEPAKSE